MLLLGSVRHFYLKVHQNTTFARELRALLRTLWLDFCGYLCGNGGEVKMGREGCRKNAYLGRNFGYASVLF